MVSVAMDLENRGARHCYNLNQHGCVQWMRSHTASGSLTLPVNFCKALKLLEKLCRHFDAIVTVKFDKLSDLTQGVDIQASSRILRAAGCSVPA